MKHATELADFFSNRADFYWGARVGVVIVSFWKFPGPIGFFWRGDEK